MGKREILGVLAAAVLLAGCGERSYDTGPLRAETRTVAPFEVVDMRGDGRVEIRIGEPAALTLEGRDRVLQGTRTEVRGDTLYISTRGSKVLLFGEGSRNLTVRISVPHLAALNLRGGNDVLLEGFRGGDSRINVEGAANIKARGELTGLDVRMAGAGYADLNELIAEQAKVTVDGVGSVYVHSKQSLDATMNGVGAIFYSGSPRDVKTRMNGLGTISQQSTRERHEQRRDWQWRERGSQSPDEGERAPGRDAEII